MLGQRIITRMWPGRPSRLLGTSVPSSLGPWFFGVGVEVCQRNVLVPCVPSPASPTHSPGAISSSGPTSSRGCRVPGSGLGSPEASEGPGEGRVRGGGGGVLDAHGHQHCLLVSALPAFSGARREL